MANRYRKKTRTRRSVRKPWLKLAKVLLAALAVCGLAYSAAWAAGKAWHRTESLNVFAISGMQISGLKHVRQSDLVAYIGDMKGVGIFDANPKALIARLEAHPWIKSASVKRELPDGFRISVVERIPAACANAGGARYLVDTEGAVLARVDADGWNYLPSILCDASKPPGVPGGGPSDGLVLALGLTDAVRAEPSEQLSAAVVHLGRDNVPYLVIDSATIAVGTDDYEGKMQRLAEIITDIRKRGVTPDRIDLRYPGKVIVDGGRASQS